MRITRRRLVHGKGLCMLSLNVSPSAPTRGKPLSKNHVTAVHAPGIMAFDKDSSRIHLASVASSAGPRSLSVVAQPLGEWYKDQGGKKSLLACTIRSCVALTHVVPLRCTLMLENGQIPEQAGLLEIPSIAGSTDMLALGPHATSVTIKFRILKVRSGMSRVFHTPRVELSRKASGESEFHDPRGHIKRLTGFDHLIGHP